MVLEVEVLILQLHQIALFRASDALFTHGFIMQSAVAGGCVPHTLRAEHSQGLHVGGNGVVGSLLVGKGGLGAAAAGDFGLVVVGVSEAGQAKSVSAGQTQRSVSALVVCFAADCADVAFSALHISINYLCDIQ